MNQIATGHNIMTALKSRNASWISQLSAALPEHVKPDRMVRVLLTSFSKTPKLLQCTQQSVWQSILDCCALGLEPDALGRAYLLPYKTKKGMICQLQIGYKGLIDLAMRTGKVSSIHSDVVCDNDLFEYELGSDAKLKHKPELRNDRGDPYCFYAYCKMKDGSFTFDVMTIKEIKRIQSRSKCGDNGPWQTDFNEMAKKTVIKRLSKTLPLSPEFMDAVVMDNDVNGYKDIKQDIKQESSSEPKEVFEIPKEEPVKITEELEKPALQSTVMSVERIAEIEEESEEAFAAEMNQIDDPESGPF